MGIKGCLVASKAARIKLMKTEIILNHTDGEKYYSCRIVIQEGQNIALLESKASYQNLGQVT